MIARSLECAGVAHAVVDVRPGPSVRQEDRRLEHAIVDAPMHRVAVFAMTGVETVRVAATRGMAELRDRYVLGNGPRDFGRKSVVEGNRGSVGEEQGGRSKV